MIFFILLIRTRSLRNQSKQIRGVFGNVFLFPQRKVLGKHQGKVVNPVAEPSKAFLSEDQPVLPG